MTNKEYADSLRLIADWFEKHDEIPVPWGGHEFNYCNYDDKKDLALLAKALGSSEKAFSDELFYLKHKFGGIEFRALAHRQNVCERVEVGKKKVQIEAKPATEAHEVEVPIYEWKCDEPLLAVKS